MKKGKLLLLTAMLFMAGSASAQDDGQLVDLLPDGVQANINPERKKDKAKNLVVVGSPEKGYKAFFAASDAEHGEELWVTDGTPEGTHMVADIVPGDGSSNPCYLGRLNDKVLFSAYTDECGQETWVSDGTEEGTFMLVETYIVGDGDPKAFTQIDENRAIFIAIDDESAEYNPEAKQYWLWITDGTPEGTNRVKEVDCRFPGQDYTTLHTAYQRVGRRVYFKADNIDGTTGEELWVTDGTPEGTYLTMDINWEKYGAGQVGYEEGWTRNSGLDNFVNYKNKKLFFQAWTPDFGGEPWVTDGLERDAVNGPDGEGTEHTYMIKDTKPGKDAGGIGFHAGCFGVGFEVYKDRVWYRGYDPTFGYEFTGTNTEKGDYVAYDIFKDEPSVDNNSYSDPGCIFDGVYMFCAAGGFDNSKPWHYGGELHYFDGNEVKLQWDFVPNTGCDWVKEQTVAGGSMYWMNEANDVDAGYGTGLYRLDSKDDSPVVCTHIVPTGDFVHSLRNLGGTICFASDATKKVYVYRYTKPNWDGVSDMGELEPEFRTPEEMDTGINDIQNTVSDRLNVYTLDGIQVRQDVNGANATNGLQKGIYIVGQKKVVVK